MRPSDSSELFHMKEDEQKFAERTKCNSFDVLLAAFLILLSGNRSESWFTKKREMLLLSLTNRVKKG